MLIYIKLVTKWFKDLRNSPVDSEWSKWRHFGTVGTLAKRRRLVKMTRRAQRRLNNEVKKQPRETAKDLKASLELDDICVHESTVCKTLDKYSVHGRIPQRKTQLTRQNVAAHLKFVKEHTDPPQRCLQNALMKLSLNYLERTRSTTIWHEELHILSLSMVEKTSCVHSEQCDVSWLSRGVHLSPPFEELHISNTEWRRSKPMRDCPRCERNGSPLTGSLSLLCPPT